MKNTKHGVSPHFSIEALKQRYLACECPRERMRWHAIWLLADIKSEKTARSIVGCTTDCVRRAITPTKDANPGVPSMRHAAPPLMAQVPKLLDIVSAVTGWKYLRRLGWTLQRPPQHRLATGQRPLKKN